MIPLTLAVVMASQRNLSVPSSIRSSFRLSQRRSQFLTIPAIQRFGVQIKVAWKGAAISLRINGQDGKSIRDCFPASPGDSPNPYYGGVEYVTLAPSSTPRKFVITCREKVQSNSPCSVLISFVNPDAYKLTGRIKAQRHRDDADSLSNGLPKRVNLQRALEEAEAGLRACESVDDQVLVGKAHLQVAMIADKLSTVFAKADLLKQAKESFGKASEIFIANRLFYEASVALDEQSWLSVAFGSKSAAIDQQLSAVKFAKQAGVPIHTLHREANFGNLMANFSDSRLGNATLLRVYKTLPDSDVEGKSYTALQIAGLYMSNDQIDKAEQWFERALVGAKGMLRARALYNRAELVRSKGDARNAIKFYEEASKITADREDGGQIRFYCHMSLLALDSEPDHFKNEEHFLRGFVEYQHEHNDPKRGNDVDIAVSRLVTCLERQGKYAEAAKALQESLPFVEELRSIDGPDERTLQLSGRRLGEYLDLIGFEAESSKEGWSDQMSARTLQWSEFSKSRYLFDILGKEQRQMAPRSLSRQIANTRNRLNQEHSLSSDEVRSQEVLLRYKIQESFSGGGDVSQTPLPTVSVMQASLGDKVAIEYCITSRGLYGWLVTSTSIHGRYLPAHVPVLQLASQLSWLVSQPPVANSGRQARIDHMSSQLSQVLIQPFESEFKGRDLIFVTPAELTKIPFSILPISSSYNGDGTHLLMERNPTCVPSLSVATRIQLESKPWIKPSSLVMFSDPIYQRKNKQGALPNLHFARTEENVIRSIIPDRNLRIVRQDAATKDAFLSDCRSQGILHVCAHSQSDELLPELSTVYFSRFGKSGKLLDTDLLQHEVLSLRMNAALLVLSACSTASGSGDAKEGVLSLSRAFIAAGCHRVLTSLWEVNGEATAELLGYFYSAIWDTGKTPSQALAEAQIKMSKSPLWSDPYYWSGFLLQGDWR